MRVLLSGGWTGVDLVRENFHTIIVRLMNGRCIKRHKRKHIIDYVGVIEFRKKDIQPEKTISIFGFLYKLPQFIKNLFIKKEK